MKLQVTQQMHDAAVPRQAIVRPINLHTIIKRVDSVPQFVAPTDFTDARAMGRITDGELFWKISHGRRPMPAFHDKLTEQERWQLVDYIRVLARKSGGGAAPGLNSPSR